jgi:glucosamine-6-phosphate deaminase
MEHPAQPNAAACERIATRVFDDPREACVCVARDIAGLICARSAGGRRTVLGLPTGATPAALYEEFVRLHREQGLSFRDVVTFNLDEYFPMQPENPRSYQREMRDVLFDPVDIRPENTHVPDGTAAPEDVPAHCAAYENAIADAGGIDHQILGIGRTGHIGFNEPGSARTSLTRLVALDEITRLDAANAFQGLDRVPAEAITMGVSTILAARRITLLAFGAHKAPIVARAVEGEVTPAVAASFLQEHPDATIVLDVAAAAELTRFRGG